MDKKKRYNKYKLTVIFMCINFVFNLNAQNKADYQPISDKEQVEIGNSLFTNDVESYIFSGSIPVGFVTFTDVLNTVSYNPIEGTRIRLSAKTNDSFSKRAMFSAMVAYGTKDKEFKYSVGGAYNFYHKAKSVYAYPASTLAINYEDNTYLPSYSNYDLAYYSIGSWDRFYFAKKKQATLSFTQDFPYGFTIKPYTYWQKIDSYIFYDKDINDSVNNRFEMLDGAYDYTDKAFGVEFSFLPSRKNKLKEVFQTINSRFYFFDTQVRLSYSYNIQKYKSKHEYSKIEFTAQHRIKLSPMSLDFRVVCGKIFGTSDSLMYFSANYMFSAVSNYYGFNLYAPNEKLFYEYLQTYTQLNFGGLFLDNIPYFKKLRSNEFINFKALFSRNNDVYCEAGTGVDHILGFLGVEIVKRFSKKNPYDMPEWGLRIRCTL